MSVLVQFRVRVSDVDRFAATSRKFEPIFAEEGARNQRIFRSESDPNEVCSLAEWDSHDQMHASSDKHGDEFNTEAGTEGLEWETRIWHEL
jgi:quinol monooxygenase YgiN